MAARPKNDWARKRPSNAAIKAAQKLAKKVDPKLLELMEARTK